MHKVSLMLNPLKFFYTHSGALIRLVVEATFSWLVLQTSTMEISHSGGLTFPACGAALKIRQQNYVFQKFFKSQNCFQFTTFYKFSLLSPRSKSVRKLPQF